MTSTFKLPTTSRRQMLKYAASIPAVPMFAGIGATLLGGCSSDDETTPAVVTPTINMKSAIFYPMAAPNLSKPADMATTLVNSSLEVTLEDNSKLSYMLSYESFFVTGDLVSDGKGGKVLAGGYYDINNQPILDRSGAVVSPFYSDCPDGTSLLALPNAKVTGVKGKPVFAVVQFEYKSENAAGDSMYGQLPSPIAILSLDQHQTTGQLDLVKYHNVDMSSAHGLWITCGASLSPWNTHLSSEEYEPDAFTIADNALFKGFSKNVFGDELKANPYHYGHLPEITVNPDGTGSVKKHYCLGRISHELIEVMPDLRTAIMGDDNTNAGLFMFVADKEKDLSSGSLYVAKYAAGWSVDPAASTSGAITWIKLGSATSAEIEQMANTLKPTDIMDVKFEDPQDATYSKVFVNGTANWIKVKPNMEKAAAFLETHRYADLMGGSMAFTKMEGTTVNIKDKVAYSALANVQGSMVRGDKAWRASANITVESALKAGVVLAHPLAGGQKDSSGALINSDWVAKSSYTLLAGKDIPADALGNTADPELIASADNLKFSEKLRTLFIGEDSGNHVNNFIWAYNVDTKKLTRIMSMPAAAEATGLGVVDDLNGFTYITANFQHAGDWGGIHAKIKDQLEPILKQNYKNKAGAAVGYITTSLDKAIKLKK